MSKATLLVTFDTELLWDVRGQLWREKDVRAAAFVREKGLASLLRMLDELRVPATFAIVAHLLYRPGEIKIPDHLLEHGPGNTPLARCWYASIAEHFERQSEGLYWPALVDILKQAKEKHEIASHTLTHPVFDEAVLSPEAACFEIQASVQGLEQAFGRRPTAFVFPRNRVGYLSFLKSAGLTTFRGPDGTWWSRIPGAARKIAHLADRILCITPPVYTTLSRREGLMDVPGSMLFLARSGFRRLVPLRCRYVQAAKGVASALRSNGVFHLWLHPIDLGYDDGVLLGTLYQVLKLMATAVKDGKAVFATMSSAAAEEQVL